MASISLKGIIYFRITMKLFTSIQFPGIGCGINRVKFLHPYRQDIFFNKLKNQLMQKHRQIQSLKNSQILNHKNGQRSSLYKVFQIVYICLERADMISYCCAGERDMAPSHLLVFLLFLNSRFLFLRKLSGTCFKWSSELRQMP